MGDGGKRCSGKSLFHHKPSKDYHEALEAAGIPAIITYIEGTGSTFFRYIVQNKLNELLPSINETSYNLRRNRHFAIPDWRTNRFRNTFYNVLKHQV